MVKIMIDMDDFKKKLDKAAQGIAFDLQEEMKGRLTREHGKDTGLLQSSIRIERVAFNEYAIVMEQHGKFLEYGTPPHMPPVDALEGWARRKLGDPDLKWAVAYAIKRRGTRPYPFIRPTFENIGKIAAKNLKWAFG